jgi:hypothetical protein
MPIIYVHGAALRKQDDQEKSENYSIFDHLLRNIDWTKVEQHLRECIAPVISSDPENSKIFYAYWGDLGSRLAWNGASSASKEDTENPELNNSFFSIIRSKLALDIRSPLNGMIALFLGDVFNYLTNRGDSNAPGPIPLRILDQLIHAQSIKDKTGEPIVVLSYSMGCEIMYDIVTYFLPKVDKYKHIKVDFWCGVGSQVGLFEELKLFLSSSDNYGIDKKKLVPFPDRAHLTHWWNVWDVDDVISYSVSHIIEGVDDRPYRGDQMLLTEHTSYLQEKRFYEALAEWISSKMPHPSKVT